MTATDANMTEQRGARTCREEQEAGGGVTGGEEGRGTRGPTRTGSHTSSSEAAMQVFGR